MHMDKTFPLYSATPSPWFVWISLVRIFKPIPKDLVHADSRIFGRVNPSLVCKLAILCISDFICAFLVDADSF